MSASNVLMVEADEAAPAVEELANCAMWRTVSATAVATAVTVAVTEVADELAAKTADELVERTVPEAVVAR